MVAVLCLSLGLAIGALWQSHRGSPSTPDTATAEVGIPAPADQVAALPSVTLASVEPATLAEVKRQLPDFAAISVEEGTRILREAALNDFKLAMDEMVSRLRNAQERVTRAQEANAENDKQAALRELQQLQAEQAAKLKDATVRSSAQVEAFRQLKASVR